MIQFQTLSPHGTLPQGDDTFQEQNTTVINTTDEPKINLVKALVLEDKGSSKDELESPPGSDDE